MLNGLRMNRSMVPKAVHETFKQCVHAGQPLNLDGLSTVKVKEKHC